MRVANWAVMLVAAASLTAAFIAWKKADALRAGNEALRAEMQAVQQENARATEEQAQNHEQEVQRLRNEAREVQKLRSEVSQLRADSREAEKLRAENQQLRAAAAASSAAPAVVASAPAQTTDYFSRENWAFSGYATPEAALVSAIWAMREGTPQAYLDSLSPEEQLRMAKVWENKSVADIAAKHRQDVAAITGVRIVERQNVSPDQVLLNVYIEGTRRLETVSMDRVGQEWKFGGFQRNARK